jgi:hypothetical protein
MRVPHTLCPRPRPTAPPGEWSRRRSATSLRPLRASRAFARRDRRDRRPRQDAGATQSSPTPGRRREQSVLETCVGVWADRHFARSPRLPSGARPTTQATPSTGPDPGPDRGSSPCSSGSRRTPLAAPLGHLLSPRPRHQPQADAPRSQDREAEPVPAPLSVGTHLVERDVVTEVHRGPAHPERSPALPLGRGVALAAASRGGLKLPPHHPRGSATR